MIEKNAIIDVRAHLLKRATEALRHVSFGLSIVAIDVVNLQMATESGKQQPGWGILYYAKGTLVGEDYNIPQMTGFANPYVSDEEMKEGLSEGCAMLREARAKQMNGAK